MPEIVTCPNCSRKLRVPDDLLGKKVKCPDCKEPFLAQTQAEGVESPPSETPRRDSSQGVSTRRGGDSDEPERAPLPRIGASDDEDHPDRGDEYDDDYGSGSPAVAGWRTVRLGLTLMLWGIYIILGGLAIYLLCALVGVILAIASGAGFASALTANTQSGSNNAGAAAGTALVIGIVVIVIGYVIYLLCVLTTFVLQTIAHVLFLYIPNKPGSGRRGLAITQTSLYAAMILLPFAGCSLYCFGIGAGSSMRNAGVMAGGLAGYYCAIFVAMLCYLAWIFVHLFFLRSVAKAMGNFGLARSLVIYMITYPTFIVLSVLSIIAVVCVGGAAMFSVASSSASSGSGPGAGGAALGGWMIAIVAVEVLIFLINIAMMVWYVVMLHQTRGSITRRLAMT